MDYYMKLHNQYVTLESLKNILTRYKCVNFVKVEFIHLGEHTRFLAVDLVSSIFKYVNGTASNLGNIVLFRNKDAQFMEELKK